MEMPIILLILFMLVPVIIIFAVASVIIAEVIYKIINKRIGENENEKK